MISEELSALLETSRAEAKLELVRATARKELSEGEAKTEDGAAANSAASGMR